MDLSTRRTDVFQGPQLESRSVVPWCDGELFDVP